MLRKTLLFGFPIGTLSTGLLSQSPSSNEPLAHTHSIVSYDTGQIWVDRGIELQVEDYLGSAKELEGILPLK